MFRKFLKDLLPPVLSRSISGLFYGWRGNYPDWQSALSKCSGYNSHIILEKVKESSLKVKEGLVPYERDSVIFDEIQYSFPLLASLMWIAVRNNRKLNVLDFGGSLGTSYYQNKFFLNSLDDVNWSVVEQYDFVRTGREFFMDDRLKFYNTIDECIKENSVNIILLSSVLQYIEDPYELLNNIINRRFKYILIDRTQFINDCDRITIQKVKPSIYNASYPCWFFNKPKFVSFMSERYDMIYEFDSPGQTNIRSEFKGFLFSKKETVD